MKTIEENWEKIDAVENKLKEHFKTDEGGFGLGGMTLTGGKVCYVSFKYHKKKRDGSHSDRQYEERVAARYCPFSGKPLYEFEK
jgi:hypothetical protein